MHLKSKTQNLLTTFLYIEKSGKKFSNPIKNNSSASLVGSD